MGQQGRLGVLDQTRTVGRAQSPGAAARIARQSPMNTTKAEDRPAYAGVDISKDALDVSLAGESPSRYTNNPNGVSELIKSSTNYRQEYK